MYSRQSNQCSMGCDFNITIIMISIMTGFMFCGIFSTEAVYEKNIRAVHIPRVSRNVTQYMCGVKKMCDYTFSVYSRTFDHGLFYSDTFGKQCDRCDPDYLKRYYNHEHNEVRTRSSLYVRFIVLAILMASASVTLSGLLIRSIYFRRESSPPLLPQ